MLSYLAIVAAFIGFCNSAPKIPQRGCNAAELQNMLDCMLLDQKKELKAVDSAIAKCISTNKCTFGDLWAPMEVSPDGTDAPIANSEIHVYDTESITDLPPGDPVPENNDPYMQFSAELMEKCFEESEAFMLNKVQPEIVNCVKNTSKPSLEDFDYPKFPNNFQTTDPDKENQFPSQTCQRQSLNACANGRYQAVDRDVCSLQMSCMHTCQNCNFTLTTKALCTCADQVIRSKVIDIKNNFTGCLLRNSTNKSLQFNVSKEMEEAEIGYRLSKYCFNCTEKATQPCGKEDLESLTWCVMGESDAIAECYKSTNCPMRDRGKDKKQTAVSDPFEKYPNKTAITLCEGNVFMTLTDDIKTCIRRQIPYFEYPEIDFNDNDDDDKDNSFHGSSDPIHAGGCNKEALKVCLEGRLFKDSDDLCTRETICAKRKLTCDLAATKKAACSCATNEINTKFDDLQTQLYTCLEIKDQTKYPVTKEQRNSLNNEIKEMFCSCPAS